MHDVWLEEARMVDPERMRRLAGALETVARRAMPVSDADRQDLGTILAELLAVTADAIAYEQTLISDEAYLPSQGTPEAARLAVTVGHVSYVMGLG
jgi:hypothetical protein